MGNVICGKPATHRVIWPGSPPIPQCEDHTAAIQRLGSAMGCPVHLIAVEPGDVCTQKVDSTPDAEGKVDSTPDAEGET
jgi:hypothetical protein